jgi:chemotaxis protein methyltransferase WspC
LFVGPAELPLVLDHGFVSAGIPMAFACRKDTAAATLRPVPRERAAKAPVPTRITIAGSNMDGGRPGEANNLDKPLSLTRSPLLPRGAKQKSWAATPSDGPAAANIETARHYANTGRLKEAVAICEDHLRDYGSSAEAYYLLGLVLDAQGSPKALDCYRKALYLEPDHYETLLQMALLSQRNGDAVRADSLKRRALRITLKRQGESELMS